MVCVLFKLLGAGNQKPEDGGQMSLPPPSERCGVVVFVEEVGPPKGMIAKEELVTMLHSTVVLRCGAVYPDRDER
jgi:hypothetical protein